MITTPSTAPWSPYTASCCWSYAASLPTRWAARKPARCTSSWSRAGATRPGLPLSACSVVTVAIMITFSTRKQNRNYQLGACSTLNNLCNLLNINFNIVLMTFIFEFKISQIRNYMFIWWHMVKKAYCDTVIYLLPLPPQSVGFFLKMLKTDVLKGRGQGGLPICWVVVPLYWKSLSTLCIWPDWLKVGV